MHFSQIMNNSLARCCRFMNIPFFALILLHLRAVDKPVESVNNSLYSEIMHLFMLTFHYSPYCDFSPIRYVFNTYLIYKCDIFYIKAFHD